MDDLLNQIIIGTAYYPEHWPRERWQKDINDILGAGMSIVRVAELAWGAMEPRDGEYNFGWLDDFIEIAGRSGLKVFLGTPSEATPVWLRHKHPEVVRVNRSGHSEGGRGNHCHNNPVLHQYVIRITEQMAARYGHNPAVAGWQTDNELRSVECYCTVCVQAFRDWLQKKYGAIESLNEAWGTTFWSQQYSSFEEVTPPQQDQLTVSTSQILDFKRFCSWSTVNYQDLIISAIRSHAQNQPISHNSLIFSQFPALNQYDMAKNLDFMAWDAYPHVDDDYITSAMAHDLIRSTKHDSFWVLEQKNGYFNGADYNLAISPGLVRAWAYMDISRGANGVMFYRYRANRWSFEQNPNGILRHDASKRRAYYEIKQLCTELTPVNRLLARTKIKADVAIIHNYEDFWSGMANKQYANFDSLALEQEYYSALLALGITPDLIQPEEDMSAYKVVIAPNMMLVSRQTANNLEKYVAGGGCLVLGVRSGIKDMHNVVVDTPWPGLLRELCGVTVEEFEAFPDHVHNSVVWNEKTYDVLWWADIMKTSTARTEIEHSERFYRGTAAVTVNSINNGKCIYFGVAGCYSLIHDYLEKLLSECGIATVNLPDRVFLTLRTGDSDSFAFLINLDEQEHIIELPFTGTDCLTGAQAGGSMHIKPLEVLLIQMA